MLKLPTKKIAAVGLALTIPLATTTAANAEDNIPTTQTLATAFTPDQTPAIAGGELHGTTTQKADVEGYGTIVVTINNDTGDITEKHPDGSIQRTNITERARQLESVLKDATPQQQAELQASQESRISKEDVCPYLVTAVGTAHAMSWGKVLALAAVNPAIAALAALGEAFFWTWVGSHC